MRHFFWATSEDYETVWTALGEYVGPARPLNVTRYVMARVSSKIKRDMYLAYVADSIQLAPQGKCFQNSWSEVMRSARKDADMSADDVIEHIAARLERE